MKKDLTQTDYALAGMAIASVLANDAGWQELAEKAALDMYRLRAILALHNDHARALYDCMIVTLAETGTVWANARYAANVNAKQN